jgi:uncharacterized protein (DUF1501 family)
MCDHHQNSHRHGFKLEHGEAHTRDHQKWSRRSFLASLGLASLGSTMMLGGMPVQAFSNSSLLQRLGQLPTRRVLVLIQLNGGNDGLNTVVPVEDSVYYNIRPTIAIPKQESILLDDMTGLHPAMASVMDLWNNDAMSVVQSVGYADSSRSHFRGTDIWASGADSDENLNSGWMGRFLTESNPDFLANPTDYPLGVRIGGTNLLFQSDFGNVGMTFGGNSQFEAFVEQGGFYSEDDLPDNAYGNALAYARKVTNASFRYVEAVQNAANAAENMGAYPQSSLGRGLSNIAKLIRGQLQTRIYLVSRGGFDTHSMQGGVEGGHADNLRDVADSVTAFYADLAADGLDQEVLTMTFSEFGRTMGENGSQGTDHGSSAPLFLFGPGVSSGIYGDAPDLVNLEGGEPIFSTDYRTVYSTVLRNWFGLEEAISAEILGDNYQAFDFIDRMATDVERFDQQIARSFKLNQNYPNPFNPNTIISFSLPQSAPVRLRVFDVNGRLIQTLVDRNLSSGNHEVIFNGSGLNSGMYFYTLETPNGSKTGKMTLIK